ncbi:LysR substrate-binding domain-containing protein [Nocardioides dubius]|uniref:LysR family transcriptional regulator n=1 Tax=Nocardioides dubius TaxID=317019 RepID=A0ABN1U122_9ACTN
MELRHLRYFSAVAETRHFGRAAERLHMAQPALSQAIRQLEAELGTSLFERTTRQVELTAAGEFLQGEAARILAAVEEAAAGVRRIGQGHQGLIRIGFTGSAAHRHLPRIAHVVREALPGLALTFHADLLTPAQVNGLREGALDLAVLRPPISGDGVRVRTIEAEPLVLAVAADHELATRAEISMRDLAGESFILLAHAASVVNEAVVSSCRAAGFDPRREHEAASNAVQLPLVAAGLGVALVPSSVQAAPLDGVVFRDVVDAATVELALAWRADEDSPAVLSVLRALQAADLFASHPEGEPQ